MPELQSPTEVASWLGQQRRRERLSVAPLVTRQLDEASHDIVTECVAVTGYSSTDVEALWADQRQYLSVLPLAADSVMQDAVFDGIRKRSQTLRRGPIGKLLICIPSNAPVPLLAMLAATALTVGDTCVVAGPRLLAPLIRRVLSCFDGLHGLAYFAGSPRTLVADGLASFDHVYFMGSSSAYASVASACVNAGAGLTFEGQGNGLVYVGSTPREQLAETVRLLLEAKRFCNGRMCSAPNSIMVHRSAYTEFLATWTDLCPKYKLTGPVDQLVSDCTAAWLKENTIIGGSTGVSYPVLCSVEEPAALPSWELFAPVAAVCSVNSYDGAERQLTANRYRLQASYFGDDPQELERFEGLNYARLCININPIDQDPIAPWGNYGLSGHSPVETFIDKLTRRQLVEVGT